MSDLGLENMKGLSDLLNDAPAGEPLQLDITKIKEDPNQPRTNDNPGFSNSSLEELASSIKERGVKTPISVREIGNDQYMINHGARRLRASLFAGIKTIPAFIDNDYNNADQVIENLQRNDLTPREIADWIGRELAAGKKKKEIAKSIGKSPAFVSQYSTLLDLPDAISKIFNEGKISDITLINQLVKLYEKDPDKTKDFIKKNDDFTRSNVAALKSFIEGGGIEQIMGGAELEEEGGKEADTGDFQADSSDYGQEENNDLESGEKGENPFKEVKEEDPSKLKNPFILVTDQGVECKLLFKRRPEKLGWGWVKNQETGEEYSQELKKLRIQQIEGTE